jgi:hypothetical protein
MFCKCNHVAKIVYCNIIAKEKWKYFLRQKL